MDLVKCFYIYNSVGALSQNTEKKITDSIVMLDEKGTRKGLLENFSKFKEAVIKNVSTDQIGVEYIICQVEEQLQEIYKQISIFDREE